jgi:hypothetical protein
MLRLCLSIMLTAVLSAGSAPAQHRAQDEQHIAQNKVRTETIRPPAPADQTCRDDGHLAAPGAIG